MPLFMLSRLSVAYPLDLGYQEWVDRTMEYVSAQVMAPMEDAAKIVAHLYAKSAASVQSAVMEAADDNVRPVLKRHALRHGYFFGNPEWALTSSMN